ncbi:MAG TPA: hypothetical protein VFK70_07890 [Vicinamibacteria bacterium]|nr:hypothetical protein [Vicinamibacteria bacterium]
MKAALYAVVLLASAGTAGAGWSECSHRSPREATVQAGGAKRIRVIARAGDLKIRGQAGASAVTVHGTACASRESGLDEIKLIAERRGDEIYVEADMSDEWFGGARGLDLDLEVPSSLPLEVEDGSGSAEIRDVAALKIEDGSGGLRIENVAGEVRVTDGSGDIVIEHAGSVVIASDGSGSLRVSGVKGSVVVQDDGSGSIDVSDVGGDFAVENDGSGGITHDGVRGAVRIPRRHR